MVHNGRGLTSLQVIISNQSSSKLSLSHCSQRFTGSRIVTNRSGHFVPIALIGLGKLLHRLCAFDFFKGNIALQNSLQDLPFFQSHMQSLAKAWYRKERRMLCKFQNLFSKVH